MPLVAFSDDFAVQRPIGACNHQAAEGDEATPRYHTRLRGVRGPEQATRASHNTTTREQDEPVRDARAAELHGEQNRRDA